MFRQLSLSGPFRLVPARRRPLRGWGAAGLAATVVLSGCTRAQPPVPVDTPQSQVSVSSADAAVTVASGNWTTFGRTASRLSDLTGMPSPSHATKGWTAALDGAVYAQPLLVNGRMIAATENNTLYGLSPTTGKVFWRAHVGTPVSRSSLPCGNIDPLGITGTPVYDPLTKWVYAVAETSGAHHTLVAVDPGSGTVKMRRNVDPPGVDPHPYQQRAALLAVGHTIYVAYGGLAGDCGNYIGTLLGVPDTGTGAITRWRPETPREGGMWNPAGPALAPNGHLLIPVGNGQVTSGRFDGSDSLTELTTGLRRTGYFAPAQWGNDNAGDQDLSSGSPAIVTVGGTTWAVIVGKSGTAYLTKVGALGGVGGQRASVAACHSLGTTATYGTTVVQNCPSSGQLMAFTVGNGTLKRKWTANASTWGPAAGGGRVFAVEQNGNFSIFSIATGQRVASVRVGSVPHFATPMLTKTSAYVGTMAGVTQIKLS
jgi:outer membrane protein assembly factor BamB